MAARTQQFKSAGSNLGQTIGQSWSMISGKDIPNYSLLFLDETLTRKRGEHETIFMPHIVLGRSSRCHVRYNDEFRTVSREHASITVDGSNFVLNHNPSASNPTYVNGKPIAGAHFLQNGDEIQLSSNGPKMRFNTTSLKTSTIGLTSRIGQAMSQAVKPYKTALLVMSLLLLASIAFSGWNVYKLSQTTKAYESEIDDVREQVIAGKLSLEEANKKIDEISKKEAYVKVIDRGERRPAQNNDRDGDRILDQLDKCPDEYGTMRCEGCPTCDIPPPPVNDQDGDGVPDTMDNCPTEFGTKENNGCPKGIIPPPTDCDNLNDKDVAKILPLNDVVVIIGKRIEVSYGGKSGEIGEKEFYQFKTTETLEDREGLTIGTGFLTDNGKLLTCRHVVQPWRYYKTAGSSSDFWRQLNVIEANGGTIRMHFQVLRSDGSRFMDFTSDEAKKSDGDDKIVEHGSKKVKIEVFGKDSKVNIPNLIDKTKEVSEQFSDWANISAETEGKISLYRTKSNNLEQGEKLYILGYSQGLSLKDKNRRPEASLSHSTVANNSTFNGEIFTSGANAGPGNSGGPAFICVNGEFYCVGIVSAVVGSSNMIVVPIGRVRGSN